MAANDRARPVLVLQLILTAVAVAAATAITPFTHFGHPAWWALPALAAAVAGAELAVLHFRIRSQPWTLSGTHVVLTFVFVLAPGSWMTLCVPAGAAVAAMVRRERVPAIVFAAAQFAFATAAGELAVRLCLHGGLPRLTSAAVAMSAFWLVQTPLVGVVQARLEASRLRVVLAVTAPTAFVHTAASASVGLLAASLSLTAPIGLVGLSVPVIVVWSLFDQTSNRSAEARLFAELARGQEQAGGGSVDGSAQVVLTAAARLLGSHYVELLVFGTDGLVRYAGDAAGIPGRRRVGVEAMDAEWVARVLASGVATGSVTGRPYALLRIGPGDRPLALMRCVRAPGEATFTRRDARLARVLVAQAESWLAVADLAASRDRESGPKETADDTARALLAGGTGARRHDVPLGAVRRGAHRLARLARGDVDRSSVEEIVAELHTVERAVASLVGAIALTNDAALPPDNEASAPESAAPRARAEWTSSGVLS